MVRHFPIVVCQKKGVEKLQIERFEAFQSFCEFFYHSGVKVFLVFFWIFYHSGVKKKLIKFLVFFWYTTMGKCRTTIVGTRGERAL